MIKYYFFLFLTYTFQKGYNAFSLTLYRSKNHFTYIGKSHIIHNHLQGYFQLYIEWISIGVEKNKICYHFFLLYW